MHGPGRVPGMGRAVLRTISIGWMLSVKLHVSIGKYWGFLYVLV